MRSAQRNNSTQKSSVADQRCCLRLELEWRRYNDAKAIKVRVANKNYNIRGHYVVFEVEYLWDGCQKNVVNANYAIGLTLNIPIYFAFSPR